MKLGDSKKEEKKCEKKHEMFNFKEAGIKMRRKKKMETFFEKVLTRHTL